MPLFTRHKIFWGSLLLFIFSNVLLYAWMQSFHSLIPFSLLEYQRNASHYQQDPRVTGGSFSLLTALGQYDSQWYLKIADQGYPRNPKKENILDTQTMGALSYNFFPLLPLIIAGVSCFIQDVVLSAFIVSNSLLLAIFVSLYYVLTRWFSRSVALKTIFLLSLFPFSIFLRGYYAEGLRLLLFIWFCFGLQERRFLLASICVGLLSITSGITLFLVPYFLLILVVFLKDKKIPMRSFFLLSTLALIPFALWMLFCFMQTGNPLYFVETRYAWYRPEFPLFHNLLLLFQLPFLPPRGFYGSQIDVLMIWLVLLGIWRSRNVLPSFVWLSTSVLAITPLFLQDSIAFARFTPVLFPLFVYLALSLRNRYYFPLLMGSIIGLYGLSLLFVNWYWIE